MEKVCATCRWSVSTDGGCYCIPTDVHQHPEHWCRFWEEGTVMKSELDKLEDYLIMEGIPYERIDKDDAYDDRGRRLYMDWHQIIAYGDAQRKDRIWDAICHRGSYGYEKGKLEIMGRIVNKEDSVEGCLTAEEVIQRIEAYIYRNSKKQD